jgi:hypothetical protein
MDHALTVGEVFWLLVAFGGVVAVIGFALWVLSIFAGAFKD